jgi:ATP-dependent Clp protease ATP-binding subunit ClpA
MLSGDLEVCLNQAFQQARSARHEFLTVEHLLLALLDAPKAREVLKGCGADLEPLWPTSRSTSIPPHRSFR